MTEARVSLPLTSVVVEVRDQTHPQGVSAVQTLDDTQVSSRFSQTLPETQTTVVHGQSMSIKVT